MKEEPTLRVCGEHQFPVMYRGDECALCEFIKSMREQMDVEFKRGWHEGFEAGKVEYEKLNKPSA